jgi:hypothetical protein
MTSSLVRLAYLTTVLAAAAALPPSVRADTPPRPFDPVGRWRFLHTDGSPFTARLAADHSAATDFGGGEHGIWRWEGSAVRMVYTDGWDDLVSLAPDGVFAKRGWAPEADRCAPPSNQTKAERIAADPGPPL